MARVVSVTWAVLGAEAPWPQDVGTADFWFLFRLLKASGQDLLGSPCDVPFFNF